MYKKCASPVSLIQYIHVHIQTLSGPLCFTIHCFTEWKKQKCAFQFYILSTVPMKWTDAYQMIFLQNTANTHIIFVSTSTWVLAEFCRKFIWLVDILPAWWISFKMNWCPFVSLITDERVKAVQPSTNTIICHLPWSASQNCVYPAQFNIKRTF